MSIQRFLNMPMEQIKRSNPQELVAKFEGAVRERNLTIAKNESTQLGYNWLPPIAIGLTVGIVAWALTKK